MGCLSEIDFLIKHFKRRILYLNPPPTFFFFFKHLHDTENNNEIRLNCEHLINLSRRKQNINPTLNYLHSPTLIFFSPPFFVYLRFMMLSSSWFCLSDIATRTEDKNNLNSSLTASGFVSRLLSMQCTLWKDGAEMKPTKNRISFFFGAGRGND